MANVTYSAIERARAYLARRRKEWEMAIPIRNAYQNGSKEVDFSEAIRALHLCLLTSEDFDALELLRLHTSDAVPGFPEELFP